MAFNEILSAAQGSRKGRKATRKKTPSKARPSGEPDASAVAESLASGNALAAKASPPAGAEVTTQTQPQAQTQAQPQVQPAAAAATPTAAQATSAKTAVSKPADSPAKSTASKPATSSPKATSKATSKATTSKTSPKSKASASKAAKASSARPAAVASSVPELEEASQPAELDQANKGTEEKPPLTLEELNVNYYKQHVGQPLPPRADRQDWLSESEALFGSVGAQMVAQSASLWDEMFRETLTRTMTDEDGKRRPYNVAILTTKPGGGGSTIANTIDAMYSGRIDKPFETGTRGAQGTGPPVTRDAYVTQFRLSKPVQQAMGISDPYVPLRLIHTNWYCSQRSWLQALCRGEFAPGQDISQEDQMFRVKRGQQTANAKPDFVWVVVDAKDCECTDTDGTCDQKCECEPQDPAPIAKAKEIVEILSAAGINYRFRVRGCEDIDSELRARPDLLTRSPLVKKVIQKLSTEIGVQQNLLFPTYPYYDHTIRDCSREVYELYAIKRVEKETYDRWMRQRREAATA